ncbi:hypothetical protein [Thermomonas brevis]
MSIPNPSMLLPSMIACCITLAACAPSAAVAPQTEAGPQATVAAQSQSAPTAAPITDPITDPGAGPDAAAIESPPDRYHGNWRVVAADDPNDAALMMVSIQSSAGEAQGSGDYVLLQPFCDALADTPITGTSECEAIGLGAAFDRVTAGPERIVLAFHPTADGAEHRLELHRDGAKLLGDYVAEANGVRRAVAAERTPDDRP